MTSFRFGPFVGRFVGEWGNTSVLVIAHVWAPYRSLAEIYVSRPVDQCDLEVFKSAILSWLDAGELNLLDDLRGAGYVSSGDSNESVDEDGPDEYAEGV